MAKKHFSYDDEFDEDDELLLDRKAKRKRERELNRQRQQAEESAAAEPQTPKDDTMNRVVALCQENRWREADLLCFEAIARYEAEGKEDNAVAIAAAQQKIDRSLRRQMIAAFVAEADKMLNM